VYSPNNLALASVVIVAVGGVVRDGPTPTGFDQIDHRGRKARHSARPCKVRHEWQVMRRMTSVIARPAPRATTAAEATAAKDTYASARVGAVGDDRQRDAAESLR
jgi:hypothetical protein